MAIQSLITKMLSKITSRSHPTTTACHETAFPQRRFSRLASTFVLGLPLLTGCASQQLGPNRPVAIDNDVAMVSSLAYPGDLNQYLSDPPETQALRRNEMVTARMFVADMEYQVYEANLTKETQREGLLATATNLGLTTSSTLVGAAATKTILSGLATGVTGLDKAYSEKELLSNAMQTLQTQMRADRKAQAADIYAKMFREVGGGVKRPTPISEYTFTMALSDAEGYYQAGTIASALVGLSRTVANKETNAGLAMAQAGPNPVQVAAAHDTAAPISMVTIPPSRTAFVAPIKTPHQRVPKPPAPTTVNPLGLSIFEKQLTKEIVSAYEDELCLPRDGNVVSLRRGLISFFNDKTVLDPQQADDIGKRGILQGNLDEFSKLVANLPAGCKKN